MASHCGGVHPSQRLGLCPFKDTPDVADAGNAVYAAVVATLLEKVSSPQDLSKVSPWTLDVLGALNVEHRGDIVEATLAAANAASDLEEGRERSWEGLRGGACGKADRVTAFLERAVRWEVRVGDV